MDRMCQEDIEHLIYFKLAKEKEKQQLKSDRFYFMNEATLSFKWSFESISCCIKKAFISIGFEFLWISH